MFARRADGKCAAQVFSRETRSWGARIRTGTHGSKGRGAAVTPLPSKSEVRPELTLSHPGSAPCSRKRRAGYRGLAGVTAEALPAAALASVVDPSALRTAPVQRRALNAALGPTGAYLPPLVLRVARRLVQRNRALGRADHQVRVAGGLAAHRRINVEAVDRRLADSPRVLDADLLECWCVERCRQAGHTGRGGAPAGTATPSSRRRPAPRTRTGRQRPRQRPGTRRPSCVSRLSSSSRIQRRRSYRDMTALASRIWL
jgi:hypothetical protein